MILRMFLMLLMPQMSILRRVLLMLMLLLLLVVLLLLLQRHIHNVAALEVFLVLAEYLHEGIGLSPVVVDSF